MCCDPQPTGNIYLEESSDSEAEERGEGSFSMLRLDDWACFKSESEMIHLALQLRQKWSALFLRRLQNPGRQPCQVSLLNTKMSDSISFKFTVCVKGCKKIGNLFMLWVISTYRVRLNCRNIISTFEIMKE